MFQTHPVSDITPFTGHRPDDMGLIACDQIWEMWPNMGNVTKLLHWRETELWQELSGHEATIDLQPIQAVIKLLLGILYLQLHVVRMNLSPAVLMNESW